MHLIIDEGNTQIKLAVFDANDVIIEEIRSTNWRKDIEDVVGQYAIKRVCVSGVGQYHESILAFLEEIPLSVVKVRDAIQSEVIPIKYKTPKTLGEDRFANAAFTSLTKQVPTLIIDCGTCLKFDVVNNEGAYLGGAISPGLYMRTKAMSEYTAQLPVVEFNSSLPDLIGATTKESLQSGAHLGMLHEIEHTITRYKERFSDLKIFITGGDKDYFVKALKNNIFADPFLTLRGLNEILKHS